MLAGVVAMKDCDWQSINMSFMNFSAAVCSLVLALIAAKWAVELWLQRLNQRHVLAHASAVPEAFKGVVDPATYAKSVQYTLAKSGLSQIEDSCSAIVLVVVLFSGLLPVSFYSFTRWLGLSDWVLAGFLFAIGIVLSLPDLPLDWYAQFRLEERFGFNTTTLK